MLIEIAPGSVIAEGTKLHGDFHFNSLAQVLGSVEGDIFQESREPIHIGKSGWVKGSIHSQGPIIIDGKVEGDVQSRHAIRVSPNAKVRGKLSAPRVAIAPGAVVNGEIRTEKRESRMTQLAAA